MGDVRQWSRVLELCCRSGYLIPTEGLVNTSGMTCYTFGPLGRTLHRNLQREWWSSMKAIPTVTVPDDLSELHPPEHNAATSKQGRTLLQHLSGAAKTKTQPVGIAHMSQHMGSEDGTTGILSSSVGHHELTVQWLVPANLTTQWVNDWLLQRLRWWKKFSATSSGFSVCQKEDDGNSSEIQYQLQDSPLVVETITNLGNKPLQEISDRGLHESPTSTQPSQVIKSVSILEPGLLAYLADAYRNTSSPMSYHKSTGNSSREYLKLSRCLCPFKVAVMAEKTGSKQYKMEVGQHIVETLQPAGLEVLDLSTAQGSRSELLNRCDSCAVPFIVEVRESTLSTGLVLLRNRDTTLQEPVLFTDLGPRIQDYVSAEDAGQTEDMLLL